jgi:hypothetical protein
MNRLDTREESGRRSALRIAMGALAVAALSLCAYAGGQTRRAAHPPVATATKPGGTTLTSIRARAASGKPAKKGPSANIGQQIMLAGSGFDDNVSVQFTAFANSTFSILPLKVKAKKVTVAVPAQVVTGPVRLIDPESGTSAPLTLQIVPKIDTLTPDTLAPGARLLVDGTGFTPNTKVTFKGVNAPVSPTVVSPTRIDIVVPATAQTGKIAIVSEGGTSKPVKLTVVGAATPAPEKRPVHGGRHATSRRRS